MNKDIIPQEIIFTTSRSSGPGGQNVNKVNSKVTLRWDVVHSLSLREEERAILLQKLKSRLTTDGIMILSSQDRRSQLENKEAVMEKFWSLLKQAMHKKKTRKATKPTKGSVKVRVERKKKHSDKKQWRKKPED